MRNLLALLFRMFTMRLIYVTVVGAALCFSGRGAFAQNQFFPGNIFELRPPHIRKSLSHETTSAPRSTTYFPFFEAPPAITPQQSVILREGDPLTAVYPVSSGSSHSGGSYETDRLVMSDNRLVLDVFTIPSDFVGHAFVSPHESGRFIGTLDQGDYQFELRRWYIPREYREQFDPATFDPVDYLVPVFQQAGQPGDGPLAFENYTLQPISPWVTIVPFTVYAIPEPSSMLLAAAIIPIVASRRKRR